MLSKKEFCKVMEQWEAYAKKEDDLNTALAAMGSDNYLFLASGMEEIMLTILEKDLNDENEWLAYFVYERNFNRDPQPCVYEEDGAPIPTGNWEEIYDMICSSSDEMKTDLRSRQRR